MFIIIRNIIGAVVYRALLIVGILFGLKCRYNGIHGEYIFLYQKKRVDIVLKVRVRGGETLKGETFEYFVDFLFCLVVYVIFPSFFT